MDHPPRPEEERLCNLYVHGILDRPSHSPFDRIVVMAAENLGTPIALISLSGVVTPAQGEATGLKLLPEHAAASLR